MEILIKSAAGAADVVINNHGKYDVLSIRNVKDKDAPVDKFKHYAKSIYVVKFDDVESAREGIGPSRTQIKELLEWSVDKTNILVHCHAGIGRSSATAYLIACQTLPPREAVKMWDISRHYPNLAVLKFGAEILNNPKVLEEGVAFRKRAVDWTMKQLGMK
jgi:predicted protein tyrosine phosphatase